MNIYIHSYDNPDSPANPDNPDNPDRSELPFIEIAADGLYKLNPLADWTQEQVIILITFWNI